MKLLSSCFGLLSFLQSPGETFEPSHDQSSKEEKSFNQDLDAREFVPEKGQNSLPPSSNESRSPYTGLPESSPDPGLPDRADDPNTERPVHSAEVSVSTPAPKAALLKGKKKGLKDRFFLGLLLGGLGE